MNKLKVGVVQQCCCDDREANIGKSMAEIRKAVQQGAGLVVLQELHATPYFCQIAEARRFDLAEPINGTDTIAFGSLARELGVVIVISMFERRAPGIYHNTAITLERDGSVAGIYRKMHIPDDPGYHEKFYFTPGDLGFTPIDTSVGRLGVLICWDQWYPEAARLMALAGADLLIYPTAIGWDLHDTKVEQARQLEAWVTVQRGHAVANALPIVVANRVGFEASPEGGDKGQHFWGNSFMVGPQGEFFARAGDDKEETLVAEIDFDRCEEVRRIWPFLRDRRTDAYGDLLKRYRD